MRHSEKKLEELIEKLMFLRDIPGLAVAVGEGEEVLYAKGFGVKNVDTGEPVEPETIFHMASVTKLFVGTSLMQLRERKGIDLHKPVVEYLPYFRLKDERYKKITLFQLLSHFSGMPDCEDYGWDKPAFDDQALERYVKGLGDLTLLWEPGERFSYSNPAYEVLGDVIAKLSGESFEDYVQNHILKPLKMENSALLTAQRKDRERMASPHVKDKQNRIIVSEIYPYNREHAPSSTLTSNVLDMVRWGAANLNRGELEGNRILDASSYELMWSPVGDINEREKIGISWFLKNHREYQIMGHEGNDIGFRSSFSIMPEKNLSVTVVANIQTATTKKIMHMVYDWVLGFEPQI